MESEFIDWHFLLGQKEFRESPDLLVVLLSQCMLDHNIEEFQYLVEVRPYFFGQIIEINSHSEANLNFVLVGLGGCMMKCILLMLDGRVDVVAMPDIVPVDTRELLSNGLHGVPFRDVGSVRNVGAPLNPIHED